MQADSSFLPSFDGSPTLEGFAVPGLVPGFGFVPGPELQPGAEHEKVGVPGLCLGGQDVGGWGDICDNS